MIITIENGYAKITNHKTHITFPWKIYCASDAVRVKLNEIVGFAIN